MQFFFRKNYFQLKQRLSFKFLHQQTEHTMWAYELVSAAGESISRDGDAGASLPSGWALRFSGGQTESPQRSRWASAQDKTTVITTFIITWKLSPDDAVLYSKMWSGKSELATPSFFSLSTNLAKPRSAALNLHICSRAAPRCECVIKLCKCGAGSCWERLSVMMKKLHVRG